MALTQERGKSMGIVCVYLVEILLEFTLAPVAMNELLRERSPFPRAGHILFVTLQECVDGACIER